MLCLLLLVYKDFALLDILTNDYAVYYLFFFYWRVYLIGQIYLEHILNPSSSLDTGFFSNTIERTNFTLFALFVNKKLYLFKQTTQFFFGTKYRKLLEREPQSFPGSEYPCLEQTA